MTHQADDTMAGTQAKCRCGYVLTIPQKASDFAEVTCPACGKHHRAAEAMFGTVAECPCGTSLQIPDPRVSSDATDSFWDELAPDAGKPNMGEFASPTETIEDESQKRYAALYAMAIGLIQSGYTPKRVCNDLISRGVPPDVAQDMIRQIAPRGYVERSDNRAMGRARMLQGGVAILSGVLIGLIAHRIGVIALISLILILVGLFRFVMGLISFVTGAR